jgi:hypothetical protein
METYTIWRIMTVVPGQRYRVEYETNDDNDDGIPDGEVTRESCMMPTLERAQRLTGHSRMGWSRHAVTVFLDGTRL